MSNYTCQSCTCVQMVLSISIHQWIWYQMFKFRNLTDCMTNEVNVDKLLCTFWMTLWTDFHNLVQFTLIHIQFLFTCPIFQICCTQTQSVTYKLSYHECFWWTSTEDTPQPADRLEPKPQVMDSTLQFDSLPKRDGNMTPLTWQHTTSLSHSSGDVLWCLFESNIFISGTPLLLLYKKILKQLPPYIRVSSFWSQI